MKRNVGLWIDHKRTFIVWQDREEILEIPSDVEPRISGGARIDGMHNLNMGKEQRFNDRFEAQLREYYQKVISNIQEAEHILIMGPGEAKLEFRRNLLTHKDLRARVMKVESADKMTIPQMAAHVRAFFKHALAA